MFIKESPFYQFLHPSHFREKVESAPAVLQWRADIIEDILRSGVESSTALASQGKTFLGSRGSSPHSLVYGCILKPPYCYDYHKGFTFANAINIALYNDSQSVLPVIVERPESFDFLHAKREEVDILRRRINSSFLVVSQASEIEQGEFGHAVRESPVLPEAINGVIFPEDIWSDYTSFRGVLPPTRISVRRVAGSIYRKVWHNYYTFKIPDYEKEIRDLLSDIGPIWIHGVRLPIHEDIR